MGLSLGSCSISSPSHTSTKNGEFTSQITRTRLDVMQCAYECKHINSHMEFSWFLHSYISSQYDSIPCDHHVNTLILYALAYHYSYTIRAIQFKQYHASNTHGQFQSKKSLPDYVKIEPRTVRGQSPHQAFCPISWDWNAWPFPASQLPTHFHGFLDKKNRVGENPYLLEFVKTPRLRPLCEALSTRMDFPSCSV